MVLRRYARLVAIGWVALVVGPAASAAAGEPPAVAGVTLATAPKVEHQTLRSLVASGSVTRRAIAAMRLERYECDDSRRMLGSLLDDDAWQVRVFAIRALGRRSAPLADDRFDAEEVPRVLRAALRYGYPVDPARVERGVRRLARSGDLELMMLGVELGAASGIPSLEALASDTARRVILRMGRTEAGALSPRLAALTGQDDLRRHHAWKQWLMKQGRRFEIRPGRAVSEGVAPLPPGRIAGLDPEAFSNLEQYIQTLSEREIDLAVCLDCTASMWGELAAAQGGIDDMMLFLDDVVGRVRIGIVAYRDRRDEFETRGWEFTDDVSVARSHLWQLTAAGGGDSPEAVFPALRLALSQLTWMPEHTKVLVLVGDAPPHVGFGTQCVDLVRRAAVEARLTTHVIQAVPPDRSVPHFADIAEAGGGRSVHLADDDALVGEITGLAIGGAFDDEMRELFATYLQLCR